jgi:hypothetical protein
MFGHPLDSAEVFRHWVSTDRPTPSGWPAGVELRRSSVTYFSHCSE